ncbi:hypothetical protein BJX70DRAFT_355150 [Aspergillus crustosus]
MTDYATWKVTDLKAELKRRGIPQTGLRVKQQIIDRLVEEDSKGENGDSGEASTAVEPAEQQEPQPAQPEIKPEAKHAPESEPQPKAEREPGREPEPEAPAKTESLDETNKNAGDAEQSTAGAQTVASTADIKPIPQPQPPETEEHSKENQESKDQEREETEHAAPAKTERADETDETNGTNEPAQDDTQGAPVQAEIKAVDEQPIAAATTPPRSTKSEEPAKQDQESRERDVNTVAQTSGPSTGLSTPLPTEDFVEDVRKRKRRSQSPAPSLEEVASKKAKVLAVSSEEKELTGAKGIAQGPSEPQPEPNKSSLLEGAVLFDETGAKKATPQKQDMRFKGLFSSTGQDKPQPGSPPADVEMEDASVEPALHAATAALYIDGLMRPLQPASLKAHLVSVATPAGKSPNADMIVDFYLDSIKTHCFAKFLDVSTASRARVALHGAVWPNEKNRKALFVDFIPDSKMQDWIQREEDARDRRGPQPRWEVKYDKKDGEVEAILKEVDPKSAGTHVSRAPASKEFPRPPPRGPRAELQAEGRRPSGPPQASRSSQPGQGFKPLDELFKSTTAKPKLYYLPVPREVADRRLDRFDELLKKGEFPRRGGDETRKISFEDGDQFIDLGAEFAGRGRGGGRGRGRGGGMANPRPVGRRDRY